MSFVRVDYYQGRRDALPSEEQRAFDSRVLSDLSRICSTGASVKRVMKHHDTMDLGFISAYRTDTDPKHRDRGGYGFFREGEVDQKGNVRKEGEPITHKENQRRHGSMAQALQRAGIPFVMAYGHYDHDEQSFVCINRDSLPTFAEALVKIGHEFDQDSVLIYPKAGDGLPYFAYYDGHTEELRSDKIEEVERAAAEYFTDIHGHAFQVGSARFFEVSGFGSYRSLSPISNGMELMIPYSWRKHNLSIYIEVEG